MKSDEFAKRLDDADAVFEGFRQMSDMLNGAVKTLIVEGWTDEQAREIVVATFIQNARGKR